jgi:hypothetical protein
MVENQKGLFCWFFFLPGTASAPSHANQYHNYHQDGQRNDAGSISIYCVVCLRGAGDSRRGAQGFIFGFCRRSGRRLQDQGDRRGDRCIGQGMRGDKGAQGSDKEKTSNQDEQYNDKRAGKMSVVHRSPEYITR